MAPLLPISVLTRSQSPPSCCLVAQDAANYEGIMQHLFQVICQLVLKALKNTTLPTLPMSILEQALWPDCRGSCSMAYASRLFTQHSTRAPFRSPVLAGLAPLAGGGGGVWPHHMCDAYADWLVGRHAHLVGQKRLGHHGAVMAAMGPHFPENTWQPEVLAERDPAVLKVLKPQACRSPPIPQSLWASHSIRCQCCGGGCHRCHLLPGRDQDLLGPVRPCLLHGRDTIMQARAVERLL